MLARKGITIVEIITVVIVISILAAVAIPQYVAAIERAQVGKVRSRIDMVRKAEAAYFVNNMSYSTVFTLVDNDVPEVTSGLTFATADRGFDGEWTYSIGVNDESYTVTATRRAGVLTKYAGRLVCIDNDGQVVTGSSTHPLAR